MNETTKKLLIGAAIAGVMGMTSTQSLAKSKKTKCEGGNSCKGQSACKSANNECKGKNGCKGQGWTMEKSKKACDKKVAANKVETKKDAAPAPGGEAPKAN